MMQSNKSHFLPFISSARNS